MPITLFDWVSERCGRSRSKGGSPSSGCAQLPLRIPSHRCLELVAIAAECKSKIARGEVEPGLDGVGLTEWHGQGNMIWGRGATNKSCARTRTITRWQMWNARSPKVRVLLEKLLRSRAGSGGLPCSLVADPSGVMTLTALRENKRTLWPVAGSLPWQGMERREPYLPSMGVSGCIAISIVFVVAFVSVVFTESVVLTDS